MYFSPEAFLQKKKKSCKSKMFSVYPIIQVCCEEEIRIKAKFKSSLLFYFLFKKIFFHLIQYNGNGSPLAELFSRCHLLLDSRFIIFLYMRDTQAPMFSLMSSMIT